MRSVTGKKKRAEYYGDEYQMKKMLLKESQKSILFFELQNVKWQTCTFEVNRDGGDCFVLFNGAFKNSS